MCHGPFGSRRLRWIAALGIAAAVCLPAQQTVWFTPLPYAKHPDGLFGAPDYLKLFTPTAPWQQAAAHVRVFKVYSEGLDFLSDSDLRKVLADLRRRQIALAMEWPVLTSKSCGVGIEGFGGDLQPVLKRIKASGGTLTYLAMEQPFQWGSLYKGKNSCQWTPQQVASNALVAIKEARRIFPRLQVGDIMAVPTFRELGADSAIGVWLDTWKSVAGAPLAFFHVDVDWTVPNWQAAIAAVRSQVEKRGIHFGIVYNGFLTQESDSAWMSAAENHFIDYEVHAGNAPPDQVDFQSWNPHPSHVLPETDPMAFTHLIDRYLRTRTRLTLTTDGAQFHGTLRTGKAGVAGANIQITAQPLSGDGALATYTISGPVPAQAHSALVGARINSECYNCSGANDMTVYSFEYSENTQRRPFTWDFAKGINGWSFGPGAPVFDNAGPAHFTHGLRVKAQRGQALGFNSTPIEVTPNARFTLQITARVAPVSVGSGYFTVIWFTAEGREPSREVLLFQPRTTVIGSATTAADGSFKVANLPNSDAYEITAEYNGSDTLWPAVAKAQTGASPRH